MGRKRTGSVRERGDRFYFSITLRSKVRREFPVPRLQDVKYDRDYAERYARRAVDRYEAGTWDPEAPAMPEPDRAVTVLGWARTWIEKQTYETQPAESAILERYLPRADLGRMRVFDVRPRHLLAFIDWLKSQPSERGDKLAPRTIRNAFDIVRRAFKAARLDEIITADPCEPVRGELPAIEDKDPIARDGWVFSREHVARLCTSTELLPDRRVANAVRFFTGVRFGEFAVVRVRDWDRAMEPLTRITIARARKSVSRKEGRTKTGAKKLVPVHPALAQILEDWLAGGWIELMGRKPEPDDLMFPTVRGKRKGEVRESSAANRAFRQDQERLKIEPVRHQHCARHTFVTLTQDDGGEGSVLRWITHAPPKSGHDGYTRAQWVRLCAELAKLRIPLGADSAERIAEVPPSTNGSPHKNQGNRSGSTEESKPWDASGTDHNPSEFRDREGLQPDSFRPLSDDIAEASAIRVDPFLSAALAAWDAEANGDVALERLMAAMGEGTS